MTTLNCQLIISIMYITFDSKVSLKNTPELSADLKQNIKKYDSKTSKKHHP